MRNLILSALILASAAQGALAVTYYFNGNLSEAFGSLPSGTFFSGSFGYEFPQPLNPDSEIYPQLPSFRASYIPKSISVAIGSEKINFTNSSNHKYLNIYNKTPPTLVNGSPEGGFPEDAFHIYLTGSGSLGGKLVDQLQIYLGDTSGSAFSDLNLVDGSMGLGQFEYGLFYIRTYNNLQQYTEIRSNLTSVVPEPSSLSLLALGGVVVALRRRQKRA